MPDDPTHHSESASDPRSGKCPATEPARQPHALEYSRMRSPIRREGSGEKVGAGCAYAIAAIMVSIGIIARSSSRSTALLLIPAILIGLPAVISLCFHGWRAFALGILIVCGVVLLVFGICALTWKGL